AYAHQKLGITDLAQEYQTLLQINYPNWLTNDGRVKLNTKRDSSWLNKLTFGKLGRAGISESSIATGQYTGATKEQIIRSATQLRLPSDNAAASSANASLNNLVTGDNRGINIGLGLPENESERITDQASTGSTARSAIVNPQTTNPVRRATLPDDNTSERIQLTPADTDVIEEDTE
ncbi:MAG TPA: outer membrane protein assembly factor BamD, partial [Psychrobacter sp.]|nr:outer membrane protein assembly factor BamD [Psychrobacter sp.]